MNDTLENGTNSSYETNQPLHIAVNSIQIVLGLPINSYVLGLILSGAGGTIASEFFYLNLTASVIIFCLASVFYFLWLFTCNNIVDSVCFFIFFLFLFSIPSFQCCICVERYIAVVHPVVFIRYKALRYRVACCCVVWLMALIFSSLYFWSEKVLVCILLGFSVVSITEVSFCCVSVLRALKQPGPGEGQRDGGEGKDMKSRAFRIILISLVLMLLTTICYFPFCIFVLLKYPIGAAGDITYGVIMVSLFVHPLLYIHKAGKLPCFKAL